MGYVGAEDVFDDRREIKTNGQIRRLVALSVVLLNTIFELTKGCTRNIFISFVFFLIIFEF